MPNNSEILIYQNSAGKVCLDVRLEDETVWLTQAHLCELFQKSKATISEHIKHVFEEGELDEKVVVRKFRTTTQHGAIEGKTQSKNVNFYNLDAIINLNGRELLTHAGKISHQMAVEKSELEYGKYKEQGRQLEHETSLQELETDLKKVRSGRTLGFE